MKRKTFKNGYDVMCAAVRVANVIMRETRIMIMVKLLQLKNRRTVNLVEDSQGFVREI